MRNDDAMINQLPLILKWRKLINSQYNQEYSVMSGNAISLKETDRFSIRDFAT
jgi:hypothetical protein